jgi:hypothetical protein
LIKLIDGAVFSIRNPKSKGWILDAGFWSLVSGSWAIAFGLIVVSGYYR